MSSRGTIDTYELADGTIKYRARIDLTNDEKYSRSRKQKSFDSRQAAQLWLNKMSSQKIKDEYVEPSEQKLEEFLIEWLDYVEPKEDVPSDQQPHHKVASATYAKYEQNAKNHLMPKLGDIALCDLSEGLIQEFIDEQIADGRLDGRDEPLSTSSLKTQVGVLRTALSQAQKLDLIRHNPAEFDKLQFPPEDTRDRRSFSPEQSKAFIEAADEIGTYQPLYTTALLTGLRRSEVLALTWDVIDLQRGVMEVKRALISDSHTGEIVMKEKTKTESSHRKVRLSDDVIELLRTHKKAQLERIEEMGEDDWQGYWKGERLVFTNEKNGNWIYPTNVTRTFNRILEEAGLDTDYQFHDLRSSYISLMHHLGADIEDISEAVGHSTSDVTKRIYRKTVPGVAKEDANRLSHEILGE